MKWPRTGARQAIGIDIREDVLQAARQKALAAGVQDTCLFVSSTTTLRTSSFPVDALEHFADPAGILRIWDTLLRPAGEVLVSFGPTWYHPLGGHPFLRFSRAHLVFSEKALIRWRSGFKTDGATKFSEVAGGLNQMTRSKFEALVAVMPSSSRLPTCADPQFWAFSQPPHARIHNRRCSLPLGQTGIMGRQSGLPPGHRSRLPIRGHIAADGVQLEIRAFGGHARFHPSHRLVIVEIASSTAGRLIRCRPSSVS